jgi:hypothetical protein
MQAHRALPVEGRVVHAAAGVKDRFPVVDEHHAGLDILEVHIVVDRKDPRTRAVEG